MDKSVWVSPNEKSWWRKQTPARIAEFKKYREKYIEWKDVEFHDFPTKKEAEEAWNTLIGFCVSQWMPGGDYTHEELCEQLKIYLNLL